MLSFIVSIIAVIISLCFSMITLWRSLKKDTRGEAEERTTIIVKLENIGLGINEIKSDIKAVREEIKDHETRLIKLEEQYKSIGRNI